MSGAVEGSARDAATGLKHWPVTWVALALAAWLAATLGWRALALPDEGRYVGVAWEMLRSGDWAVPSINGLPFFHKPPLFYWITAGALELFGVHPWAGRIASWLAALASALALLAFARRWSGAERAQAAVLALATLPFFYGGAQYANLDMLVAGCIGMAILALADAVLRDTQGLPLRRSLLAAALALALGMLAKGLIGIVLPLMVIGLWTLLLKRGRVLALWWRLAWWPAVLLLLALALPWFLLMQQRFPGFFDYFIVEQHLHRFAAGGFNNVRPFWFYLVAVPLLCLPWTPWLWRALRATTWREPTQQPVRWLMATWVVVVLLFFSWPKSKLIGYALPVCLPLAWCVADGFIASGWRHAERAWQWSTALALLIGPLAIGLIARYQPEGSAGLAQAMAARQPASEPLVFIDRYPFDLPLLANQPGVLVSNDDWQAAARGADDWHRELADAKRFATPDKAARLVNSANLGMQLCGARAAWFVAAKDRVPSWLTAAPPLRTSARDGLWRLDGAALDNLRPACPRTPNAAPTGK